MKFTKTRPNTPSRHCSPLIGTTLLAAFSLIVTCFQANAQTYAFSTAWVDTTNNLPGAHVAATGDVNRSIAYSAVSNIVFVCNKGITGSGTTPAIDALNGATGAYLGSANVTNTIVTGGNFWLNQIAVADDGVLYGANLSTSLAYRLYRWTNYTTAPTLAYNGNPTGGNSGSAGRIGDSIAITGSGTNTLILAALVSGTTPSTNVVLFSTVDGINFTPTLLQISGMGIPSGNDGPQPGYTFYTSNSFLYNPETSSTYLVQIPPNFASLGTPVAATATSTFSFGGNPDFLSYSQATGLLAVLGPVPNNTSATTKTAISLYQVPPFGNLASSLVTTTNFVTTNANGNYVGGVALAGSNTIYALDCNNGVIAENILFTAAAIAPSISSAPTGGSLFASDTTFTFSVSAGGTAPLYYQWQGSSSSNVLTATNILGATNSSFTITNPTIASSGWYDVVITNAGGAITSAPVQLIVYPATTSTNFTNIWSLAPGSRPYLGGNGTYDTRGMAFDTNTMTVLLADKNGSETGIFVISATNGADLFAMNTLGIGITGDQFPLDQVGVGDDGAVYACNLYDTGSTPGTFAIFSYASVSPSAGPGIAYQGDPSAPGIQDRWGDTMAVRGAGNNTQILLGSYAGFESGPSTNAALLTANGDGTFSPIPLIITNASGIPAGFCSLGICFGAGNTFWAKSPGFDLYEIAFDPATGNCNILLDIPAGTSGNSSFSSMSSICLEPTNNLLTGITFNDVPNDLAVYQLYGPSSATLGVAPSLLDQAFFPSNLGNVQDNGVTVIKGGYIFGLDINNGLTALTYTTPPPPTLPPYSIGSISNVTGTGMVITFPSYAGVTYQLQRASTLMKTNTLWVNVGSATTATSTTTSFTNAPSGTEGFYRLVIP